MEGHRKIRVIRGWEDFKAPIPRELVLVEVPGKWASAMYSLVRISEEYRHNGLIVTNIGPGSQAASAGMARGDVLLRYDGMEVDTAETLTRLTKRHAQDAEPSGTVTIEAVSGSEDVSFEVCKGPLGITVSPSLHRFKRIRVSRTKLQKADRKEAGIVRTIKVIDSLEGARRHDPGQHALVEVPGELARKVLFLVKTLEASGASELKNMTKALLSTARP